MSTLSREWSRSGPEVLRTTAQQAAQETPQHCDGICRESRVTMQRGELSSFEARTGDTISCNGGVVWLTQTGDLTDYVLHDGERFVAQQNGKVLVQAFSAAVVCLVQQALRNEQQALRN
ncbi:MAG TPA: DUF2917 domain-containing protein [Abditibacteriaceae bacterium]